MDNRLSDTSGNTKITNIDSGYNIEVKKDLSGRENLVSSVIFNWAAYFVYIVAGFIMPRLIDRQLGQDLLGIWDFAWSLVGYFGLVQFGIASSVNRYIAKYHAAEDINGINLVINSACFLLGIAGLLIFVLTCAASIMLPQLFGEKLAENTYQAQLVIFFIGTSLSIETALGPFSGLLTGLHRWGLHNFLKSGSYLLVLAFMIIALLRGGGLYSLAIITMAGQALESVSRVIFSHRICKGLRIQPALIQLSMIKKLFFFGSKTLVPGVSNMLLNQTTSIFIIAYIGPAALALFSRPRSLVLHINTFVTKMSMTLVPTISSLQSVQNFKEIRELLISSVRYSIYITLPIVLVLIIFGNAVLLFWMGPDYANSLLPAILAIGYLATIAQKPAINVLAGLNSHGRVGIAQLFTSICSVGLVFLMVGYLKLGIVGAACAVTLPLNIMSFFYLPFLVCRKVNLDVRKYFLSIIIGPAIHILPFAICLVTAKMIFKNSVLGLFAGGLSGGIIIFILYWKYVLPKKIRNKIIKSARSITGNLHAFVFKKANSS